MSRCSVSALPRVSASSTDFLVSIAASRIPAIMEFAVLVVAM